MNRTCSAYFLLILSISILQLIIILTFGRISRQRDDRSYVLLVDKTSVDKTTESGVRSESLELRKTLSIFKMQKVYSFCKKRKFPSDRE